MGGGYLFGCFGFFICASYGQTSVKSFNAYCKLFLCIQHSHLTCELMQKVVVSFKHFFSLQERNIYSRKQHYYFTNHPSQGMLS